MELYYFKYYQIYVNGYNVVIEVIGDVQVKGDNKVVVVQVLLLNFYGGGYFNYLLFWENLVFNGKGGGGEFEGKFLVCFVFFIQCICLGEIID